VKQKGYSLLELLLVISITGTIVTITGAGVIQIMRGQPEITAKNIALADIDSATHWIIRDLIMAQTTSLADGAPPVSGISINWSDLTVWAGSEGSITHLATYALAGTELQRTYDGASTTVGRYLTDIQFSLAGKLFTVTLTSRPGAPNYAVTKSFTIQMRADLGP